MKNLALLFLTVVLFTSCSKDAGPRPVAEKFLEAMQKHDYTEAAKYGSKETMKLLQQLEKVEALEGGPKESQAKKVTIVSEDIQGDIAVVYFTEEGDDMQQKITLRKVMNQEGKVEWKVSLKKEEIRLNNGPGLELPGDSIQKVAS